MLIRNMTYYQNVHNNTHILIYKDNLYKELFQYTLITVTLT